MQASRRRIHGLFLCTAISIGARTTSAANVAVVDGSNASAHMAEQWCQLLQNNGHQCTVFPASGPSGNQLAPFQVIVDLSDTWSDPDGVLADAMRDRKGVIIGVYAPAALHTDTNPLVQDWIGANNYYLTKSGVGNLFTTEHDPILGDVSPGTELTGCGEDELCIALMDSSGHPAARTLGVFSGVAGGIGILRNTWNGGQSVYLAYPIGPWGGATQQQVILHTVNTLAKQIPTMSSISTALTGALLALFGIGVLRKRRRFCCVPPVLIIPTGLPVIFEAHTSHAQAISDLLSVTAGGPGLRSLATLGARFPLVPNSMSRHSLRRKLNIYSGYAITCKLAS